MCGKLKQHHNQFVVTDCINHSNNNAIISSSISLLQYYSTFHAHGQMKSILAQKFLRSSLKKKCNAKDITRFIK